MRMQHYAIFLRSFNYETRYKRSEQNSNADCFSRLPVMEYDDNYDVVDLYYVDALEVLSVDVFDIRKCISLIR